MRYFARHGSGANTPLEALRVLLKLGRTSLGPVAHIGYFRDEFVARRKWLDDTALADPACR
jgi:chromate transporter